MKLSALPFPVDIAWTNGHSLFVIKNLTLVVFHLVGHNFNMILYGPSSNNEFLM